MWWMAASFSLSLSFSFSLTHTHTQLLSTFRGEEVAAGFQIHGLVSPGLRNLHYTHTHTHTHTQSSYWLPKTWLCFVWAQKFAFEKDVLTGRV